MSELKQPRTAIMVNVGTPEMAFRVAMQPQAGVGLARMEFIISEHIGIHPMALLNPKKIASAKAKAAIAARVKGYDNPSEFFVERLSEGVGTIAAAFYPKPVIVRLSDFKTNEYASLLGGAAFEPKEENPMLGFRGASRYSHPAYAEGFALECAALRRVREEMGLVNLRIMVPFCRTVEEGRRVIATMASHGLKRGENGLEIYVMCEIPNNVIQIDAFAELFDGFSIGSNDLTQLTLGVDRDSEIVAFDFDERDPGMLEMFRQADRRRQAQRTPYRHLRGGACELSGDRALPDTARDQFDQRQSRKRVSHHGCCARGRNEPDGTGVTFVSRFAPPPHESAPPRHSPVSSFPSARHRPHP